MKQGRDWQSRFEVFAAEKTRQAATADLYPFKTIEEHADAPLERIGNDWSRRLFNGSFFLESARSHIRPACSLVFVQSAEGNTGADNPGTLGGGDTDKHLIYEGLSRVAADAVLAGAGTVRGGDIAFSVWHPEMVALRASLGLPRHPAQIVITNRGLDFDDVLLFNVPALRVVLLTGPSVPSGIDTAVRERPWMVRIKLNERGLAGAFERLRAIGIRRVSCVGGRTLGRELLEAGLVDGVNLTTSPVRGGEPNTPIAPWPWRGPVIVRKHGTGPEAGVVFEQIVPNVAVRST